MRRAVFSLVLAGSLLALACGHEASAPSAPVAHDVEVAFAAPAVTLLQATAQPATPAQPCVEVDSELGGKHIALEGRIFVDDTFEHPARGKTRPYILRLDAPRCAIGIDETNVSELHLAAGDGIALKPLLGAHVRVAGDPFAAHTAWHARPVVLMVTSARNLAKSNAP
jgi:hypothetical protein